MGNDPVNKVDPTGKCSSGDRRGCTDLIRKLRDEPEFRKLVVDTAKSIANGDMDIESVAKKAVTKKGKKRGPKTNGEGPHNEKIKEIGDKATANGDTVVAGGGQQPERLIQTNGGNKESRRPDIIIENGKTGELSGVNVGRVRSDGAPIKREQEALDDLNNYSDIPTTFESYVP